jgi:hypothetical protein
VVAANDGSDGAHIRKDVEASAFQVGVRHCAHIGVLTVKESHVCCLLLSTTPPARTYSRSSDSTEDDDEQAGSDEGKDDAAEEIRCS